MSRTYHASQADFIDPEYAGSLPELDEKYATEIRNGFIRKVYGILLSQVLLTTIIGAIFTLNESWRLWIINAGQPLILFCAVFAIASICVIQCVPGFAEKTPGNYVALGIFTLAEAVTLGGACAITAAAYNTSVVLEAFLLTSIIVAGLTAFAFQTSYDFTGWGGKLAIALLALFGFGLIRIFFPASPVIHALFAVAGAVIFSLYLVLDTQRLVGGPGKRLKVSEDSYILISLSLYLDVINLFMEMLQLMSAMEERNRS